MIIFNTTTQVSWLIHEAWKEWLVQEQLPRMLSTGLVERYQLVRLLEVNEEEGPTYALQLYLHHQAAFAAYRDVHLGGFTETEKIMWGDNLVSFPSLMEVIN